MLVRGSTIEAKNGRKPYPLNGLEVQVKHFVIRTTTPENPFRPHKHEQSELWYIIEGTAVASIDGQDHAVQGGDLIALESWAEHGLRTENQVTWICLG